MANEPELRASIILPKKYENAVIHKIPKPYKIVFKIIQGISLRLTLKKNFSGEVCFLGSKTSFIIYFYLIVLLNLYYHYY